MSGQISTAYGVQVIDYPPELLPQLRLDSAALDHNIATMAAWCRQHDVELAPHIKTTMCRPIVDRQMAAGAWGVTVATVRQAAVALHWGHRRVLIANQVVQPEALGLLRRGLDDADLDLCCFADSADGLAVAARAFAGASRPLRVLVDVGTPGGRTGVRDLDTGVTLGRRIADTPGLVLAGVAGYEGVVPNRRDDATLAAVEEHCRRAAALFAELEPLSEAPLFTLGGSAFPDIAVRHLAAAPRAVRLLRSGCYVTHDHGTYASVCPVPGLRPALTVRASVLSLPEPGVAVVGAGRRELPYDAGLPVVLGGARGKARTLFDHHLVLDDVAGLHIGDAVDLGISHPCSAFDRWRDIVVTDAAGVPVDIWRTEFH